jgi:hypothetical protein
MKPTQYGVIIGFSAKTTVYQQPVRLDARQWFSLQPIRLAPAATRRVEMFGLTAGDSPNATFYQLSG